MHCRILALLMAVLLPAGFVQASGARPNIVLVIGEDMGPDTGAYGCRDAITPNMDRLAREGVRFTRAFTHAPVCAPSRSGMITGQYPLKYGAQNMRSKVVNAPRPFTEKLRAAGYHVLWPGKTDFQGVPEKELADDRKAWVNFSKQPPGPLTPKPKEPFFAYFNDTVSHESQVRASDAEHAKNTAALKPSDRRDPAKVELPPFYPDTPAVRREVAHYHELVSAANSYLSGGRAASISRSVPSLLDRAKSMSTSAPRLAAWAEAVGESENTDTASMSVFRAFRTETFRLPGGVPGIRAAMSRANPGDSAYARSWVCVIGAGGRVSRAVDGRRRSHAGVTSRRTQAIRVRGYRGFMDGTIGVGSTVEERRSTAGEPRLELFEPGGAVGAAVFVREGPDGSGHQGGGPVAIELGRQGQHPCADPQGATGWLGQCEADHHHHAQDRREMPRDAPWDRGGPLADRQR